MRVAAAFVLLLGRTFLSCSHPHERVGLRDCLVQGHPEIDATKVDSTRRVTDYDEETQAAIRKIMVRGGGMCLPSLQCCAQECAGVLVWLLFCLSSTNAVRPPDFQPRTRWRWQTSCVLLNMRQDLRCRLDLESVTRQCMYSL